MRILGTESYTLILKELGERIRDTRIAMHLTREELCRKTGVSLSTLARMETGETMKLDNLMRVLDALDCLSNMEFLIPEQRQSVNDIWKGKRKKQRASVKKESEITWEWGDER